MDFIVSRVFVWDNGDYIIEINSTLPSDEILKIAGVWNNTYLLRFQLFHHAIMLHHLLFLSIEYFACLYVNIREAAVKPSVCLQIHIQYHLAKAIGYSNVQICVSLPGLVTRHAIRVWKPI